MASKTVEVEGLGILNLYKRKGARHIRLSVAANGQVRVTMPHWVPYSAGVSFAKQKADWLRDNIKPQQLLAHGDAIGKGHRLFFITEEGRSTVASRLERDGSITIKLPPNVAYSDEKAQRPALTACVRALKREAEDKLPARLKNLAVEHGFKYRSIEIKRLRGRWGSCNHRQEIVLNCFLMQLPWELIDYVLLHELVHTKVMAHGPRFWGEMARYVDDLPAVRELMREHRPAVYAA